MSRSCLPRLPAPMMPSRIFPFAEAALPMAGAPNTDAAPADTPTASTKPRRVIPSLDLNHYDDQPFPAKVAMLIAFPTFAGIRLTDRTGRPDDSPGAGLVDPSQSPSVGLLGCRTEAYHVQVVSS
ncbi:MAG: hypothetical protein WBX00_25405 [Isosphaeraceae bacterium]